MMKRSIALLALPLLSITGCLDTSEPDHPESAAAQEAAETASDMDATNPAATPDAFPASCPSGEVCLYRDIHFGGHELTLPNGASDDNFVNDGFNDQMSSWCNHTSQQYCYWFNIHFTGKPVIMGPNTCHGTVLPANNDQASSAGPC